MAKTSPGVHGLAWKFSKTSESVYMRRKAKRSKNDKLNEQKNKIRGVIGNNKSRAYVPDPINRVAVFHRQLSDVLTKAREEVSPESSRSFVNWVETQTSAQLNQLKEEPTHSEVSARSLDREPLHISDEIEWVATRLAAHAQRLSGFLALSHSLEKEVLLGRLDEASKILGEVEEAHGRSIWWVEAKICLVQRKDGLDAQKQVVSELRKNHPKSLVAYIARFASIRNEPSTTIGSFHADAANRIGRIREQASLKKYLQFKLLWNYTISVKDLSRVLLVAQSLSVEDMYETLVEVLQRIHSQSPSVEIQRTIIKALKTLSSIVDPRTTKLAFLSGIETKSRLPERSRRAEQLFLKGEAKAGLRRGLQDLRDDPRAFRTAILIAAGAGPISDSVPHGKHGWPSLIRKIASLLRFDDEHPTKWADFEKELRNHTFSPTLRGCYLAVREHLEDDVGARLRTRKLCSLSCPHFDPVELALYPKQDFSTPALGDVVGDREDASGKTSGLEAVTLSWRTTPANEFRLFRSAHMAGELSLVDELAEIDALVAKGKSRALTVYVRRCYLTALIESGRVGELLQKATHSYFTLRIPASLLPLREDFAALRWRQMRAYSGDLMLANTLHLSWRATGLDSVASNLRYAYSDLLTKNGLTSPAELTRLQQSWPEDQVAYFLRSVCVPEIIDMSSQIGSSRQAQEVRRDVCVALGDLDPDNRQAYEDETFNITRTLSVQDGLRVLDSSRVHVDTGAIASWAVRELEPNIARYKALVGSGVGVSVPLDDIWKELSGKPGDSSKFLEIPDSDADMILVDLINGLRKKFLLDPSHGLDSYLSRRVRHHSMSGYLRGAAEHFHLMTTRDYGTGRYTANAYWNNQIDGITHSENYEFQKALAKFCDEFDKIILGLKADIFRINSEEHPRGIFSVSFTPPMFHIIRSIFQPQISIESLCDVCFQIFWAALGPSLDTARTHLTTSTYNSISSAIHRLQASLRRIFGDPQRYSALTVAIQSASDEIHRKIVGIADWFNRSEAAQSQKIYSLERALDICVQAALHSLKPFEPNIRTRVTPGQEASSILLVHMAEVLLPMLGNVRQHAKYEGIPDIDIDVHIDGDDALSLRVVSDIGSGACTDEARQRVDDIRRKISDGTYVNYVRTEGLSGLKKIACVALSTEGGSIEFDFVDDRKFCVSVKFEVPRPVALVVSKSGPRI